MGRDVRAIRSRLGVVPQDDALGAGEICWALLRSTLAGAGFPAIAGVLGLVPSLWRC